MTVVKYCCALTALSYLVAALLPAHLLGNQPNGINSTAPEWIGRTLFFAYFLLLGTVTFGIQTRKPIYWKLIPILLGIFLLSIVIGALWSFILLSLPWIPFMFVVVVIFIGALFFGGWWRNQRSYFA